MHFDKLPLNTQSSYIMQVDKSGCEVYIPTINRDKGVIDNAKQGLLEFLNNQPEPYNIT